MKNVKELKTAQIILKSVLGFAPALNNITLLESSMTRFEFTVHDKGYVLSRMYNKLNMFEVYLYTNVTNDNMYDGIKIGEVDEHTYFTAMNY